MRFEFGNCDLLHAASYDVTTDFACGEEKARSAGVHLIAKYSTHRKSLSPTICSYYSTSQEICQALTTNFLCGDFVWGRQDQEGKTNGWSIGSAPKKFGGYLYYIYILYIRDSIIYKLILQAILNSLYILAILYIV